eukprot:TRINITY_DN4773_c1_g1_i3.p1 TRINITY_DN4773_c1_g1~~TRINITY_DN4773_c1_g1_i3.p1  ORF type:complete len:112 (+),score=18.01 TRINITY_DN4773_c1_g1_i3:5834-6169(+)
MTGHKKLVSSSPLYALFATRMVNLLVTFFFSCPYAIELRSWILKAAGCNSTRFTPPYLWSSLSSGCDKLTKQGMAVVFSPPFMSFGKPGMELDFQTNFLLNKYLEGFFGSS